ncbi:MAG: Primosomal protein N' [Parcubacteria group bacterium GW2011_GWE1_43_8]|nr:MAG: Primosomal protein N' [Parcubacteria group bacterium GW2011_GWE1_43_8]
MSVKVAQVVPLRRLPRTKGVFDYEVPAQAIVEVGDLVQIPFKSSLVEGIVFDIKTGEATIKNLKSIGNTLIPGCANRRQLSLIFWLANYSGVSLATAAKLVLPFKPTSRFIISPIKNKPIIKDKAGLKPINIIFSSLSAKEQVVDSLVKQVINRGQQVLLLVPEISLITEWTNRFKNNLVVSYSGNEKTSNSRSAWRDIRSGQAKIIIGTRAVLWLNYFNLGGIIIDQAENESFIQSEQNPRYDTLMVANYLAKLWSASLAQISPAPRLENWQAVQKGNQGWQEISAVSAKLKVIDLKTSRRVFKSGLISAELKTTVDKVLSRGKKILLYLNRRGGATSSTCEDCGLVAICPQCQRSLVQSNNQNELVCFHCDYKQNVVIPCPHCGGLSVNYAGGGIGKLALEAKKLWPSAKILTLEDKFNESQTNLANQADIILGSRTAVRAVANMPLAMSVLVRADAELLLPEFRSVERLWQLTRYLTLQSAELVVQTSNPDHYLWSSLMTRDLALFYRSEMRLRKKYLYPPLVKLIRFTCQNKIEKSAQKQAGSLVDILKKSLPPDAEIIGPYPDYYRLRSTNWRWHILIKHALNYEPANLWPLLPDDVIIDNNPWFILS